MGSTGQAAARPSRLGGASQALLARHRRKHRGGLDDDLPQTEDQRFELQAARLHAREVEDVVEQVEQGRRRRALVAEQLARASRSICGLTRRPARVTTLMLTSKTMRLSWRSRASAPPCWTKAAVSPTVSTGRRAAALITAA